jgi:DNA-binding response OmpR family regulator
MIEREKERKDQTLLLGRPLSIGELQMYRILHEVGANPITKEELFEQLYSCKMRKDTDKTCIYVRIARIRGKLGKHSIISVQKSLNKENGYVSRRAVIEQVVLGGKYLLAK